MKISLKSNLITVIILIAKLILSCECSAEIHDHKMNIPGFNSVKIEGELKVRLNKNFDRLEEELYQPKNLFWSEKESGGWPADKEGRPILISF